MRNKMQRFGATIFTAGALALAGGCLVTSDKDISSSGTRISPQTLNQVRDGQTTESWLVGTLGEPTSRVDVSEQPIIQILRYEYSENVSSSGTVFLIFAGASEKRTTHTTYFELTDGVVTRHWTEKTKA